MATLDLQSTRKTRVIQASEVATLERELRFTHSQRVRSVFGACSQRVPSVFGALLVGRKTRVIEASEELTLESGDFGPSKHS